VAEPRRGVVAAVFRAVQAPPERFSADSYEDALW